MFRYLKAQLFVSALATVAIAALEGRRGLGSLLRLCRLHVRHRHHLFYAEGRGPVNFLRAALYCVMQVYNYRYLLPNSDGS